MSGTEDQPVFSETEQIQARLQALLEENSRLRARVRELESRSLKDAGQTTPYLDMLHRIVDSVPHLIYVKDESGRFLFANSVVADCYGTSKELLIGTLQQNRHPVAEELDFFLEEDRLVLSKGEPRATEHFFTDVSGKRRLMHCIKAPFITSENTPAILCISFDYTECKNTERELEQRRIRYDSLFNNNLSGVCIMDSQGLITDCNQRLADMLGKESPEEIEGSLVFGYLHPDDRAQYKSNFYALLEKEIDSFILRKRIVDAKGRERWHEIFTIPVMEQDGTLNCIIAFAIDVSAVFRMQNDLVRAMESAEQANKAKGEFLANMSHEIRTPLNVIVGVGDLLLRTDPTPRQYEFIDVLRNSSAVLLELINNILDFSKIEAGRLSLEQIPFSVYVLLDSVLEFFRDQAAQKGLDFHVDWSADVPETIIGDSIRLRQILVNLLGNAFKFTEKGSVSLQARTQSKDGMRTCVFVVKDTGIGISEDQLDELFQEFSQADGSISRKYGGTGLGLTISQRLVKLMRGELTVRSTPGEGSAFSVAIPLLDSHLPPRLIRNAQLSGAGALVLLVTPNNELRRSVANRLQEMGQQVRACFPERFDSVLSKMLEKQSVVAFLDSDVLEEVLPLLEGLSEQKRPRCVVLLKPGRALPATELPLQSIPCPPRRCELYDVCKGTGRTCSRNVFDEDVSIGQQFLGARVLLAEDSKVNQMIVRELLREAGCSVDTADNGEDAVKCARKNSYDVVLMDVQMPLMDGLNATRVIKQELGLRALPIIALTAFALPGDDTRCLEAGMDYYLSKPVKRKDLYETLQRALANSGKLPTGRKMTQEAKKGSRFPAGLRLQGMDLADAEERLGGKWEFYCDLVRGFGGLYGDICTTFDGLFQAGEYEELKRQVHMLKGASANISASALTEAAKRLDTALQDKTPQTSRIQELLDQLRSALAVVVANANRLP